VRLFIDQDALEPILRARAEELGAELHYRVDCTSLSQDGDGVSATLKDLDSGAERTVRSRYLVAADGNRSAVREQLGIAIGALMVEQAYSRPRARRARARALARRRGGAASSR
jgi:2-polyprenyl-6-methoxyphenol hydroxylase-like FAD-dependent oxidoreductase